MELFPLHLNTVENILKSMMDEERHYETISDRIEILSDIESDDELFLSDIFMTIQVDIKDCFNGKTIEVKLEDTKTVNVDIPKGTISGTVIKVEQKSIGIENLHLTIDVMASPFQLIDSEVLCYHKTISLKEALVGVTFPLEHLNGKIYQIRNSGKIISENAEICLPNLGWKEKTDLKLIFHVQFPDSLSEEAIEMVGKLF